MTKAEMIKHLDKKTGGQTFITVEGLKKSLQIGSTKATEITRGLPRVGGPKSGFYIGDIAERMMEMRR